MTVRLFSSVRVRFLLVILLAVLPALGLVFYTATEWRRHEDADARADAMRLASHLASIYERRLAEARHLFTHLAELPAIRLLDPAQCKESLSILLLGGLERYSNVGVLRPDGRVLCSVVPIGGSVSLEGGSLFERAIKSKALVVGDYELTSTSLTEVEIAFPVFDSADRIHAVLFIAIDSTRLEEVFNDAGMMPGTEVTLIDQNATIIAKHPDPQGFVGRSISKDPIYQIIRSHQRGGTAEVMDLDGTRRLYGFQPVQGLSEGGRVTIVVSVSETVALALANQILTQHVAGLGLVAVLAIVAAWVAGERLIVRRVQALAHTTNRLRTGDLSARTGVPYSACELGELARSFDAMAAAVESRESEVLRKNRELADLERRFRGLIENSSDGILLLTPEGTFRYASPTTTRILGHAVEALVGTSAFELIHPDDREFTISRFAELTSSPECVVTTQFRAQHKNGSWVWIECTARNWTAEPSIQGIVCNYRDISERKKSEELLRKAKDELEVRVQGRTADLVMASQVLEANLRERERAYGELRKLSSAVEQSADSVFIAKRDGVIEYVNPAFEVLSGYTREEVIGKTRRVVKSGEHDQQFYEQLWGRLLSGEVFRGVFINRKKDGELYYEEETITPLRDSRGTITHFVAAGRDITRRIRTEEALRRLNDRLEKEAERIAHVLHDEAGQFLTAAHIAIAELARELPPATRARLQDVRQDLNEIEEQLRHISHELRPRILDDLGLVAGLEFLAEGVQKRTGIRITVSSSLERNLPAIVETTLYRFAQEALTNVTKHARATQVTILLDQMAAKICCNIRDDGIGFDVPAGLARRGDPGLGLKGIQDRVEALGGTIKISSEPGRGTELLTTIPLETDDATPDSDGRRSSDRSPGPEGSSGAGRV